MFGFWKGSCVRTLYSQIHHFTSLILNISQYVFSIPNDCISIWLQFQFTFHYYCYNIFFFFWIYFIGFAGRMRADKRGNEKKKSGTDTLPLVRWLRLNRCLAALQSLSPEWHHLAMQNTKKKFRNKLEFGELVDLFLLLSLPNPDLLLRLYWRWSLGTCMGSGIRSRGFTCVSFQCIGLISFAIFLWWSS